MEGSTRREPPRTATPAVIASALFAVICAAVAVTFVAARGGLELPVHAAGSQAAIASPRPSGAVASVPTPNATPVPAEPSPVPTASPSLAPSLLPTEPPASSAPSTDPEDPLATLPGCPDHPGCFEYLVRRGDTLSGVASRYVIPVSTLRALNPDLDAAGTIVVGHVLYLGRQPYLRLDKCGGETADCYLYVVQPGDGLSTIAARYGLTVEMILDANPQIPNANTIYSGQVIRLQFQHGVI